ncbi:hypothetical protein DM860_006711 [Cuscuta australis]|uniref:IST1-like protein n=1 Tax=Cuscuta australis TaxID=267555 RepID=A0A328D8K7_9ASTE|nr:hypothetical protein DM860_006711 [Cuscuta australis]
MDSFFSRGFKASKCKTLLKLTIPRIKLLRNRREMQLKQMRKEIAKLLETGQEATARIRVEHIIREEKMMAAQEIVELFSELIAVRLPIIEAQRECPLDLKEAISSICFAAPRCADLPELLQVQMSFAGKYGKEFVAAATELRPECGVNRQLIELLSIRAPAPEVKLKVLKEIAEEHELDWDPSASESELLKPHEDLLHGPTQFVSGSKLPLPEEKHRDETAQYASGFVDKRSDSEDEEDDILDLPEVPRQQPNTASVSTPEMLPFPASALSDLDHNAEQYSSPHMKECEEALTPERSAAKGIESSYNEVLTPILKEEKTFMSPPSSSAKQSEASNIDLNDVIAAAQAAAETAERAAAAARSVASLAQLRISEFSKKKSDDESSTVRNTEAASYDSGSPQGSRDELGHNSGQVRVDGHHQPQRLASMDDESYFSYPNLFNSRSPHEP